MPSIKIWKDEVQDGLLPGVCMKCGARSTTVVEKTMRWGQPWVGLLLFLLIGVLGLLIAMLLRKSFRIDAPMCEEHAGHWRVRNMICWIPFTIILAILIGGITVSATAENNRDVQDLGGMIVLAAAGALLLWLIVAAIVQSTGIRPSEITDDSMTLKGVHENFIETLEDDRAADEEEEEERERERRARKRARRDRDDDDD